MFKILGIIGSVLVLVAGILILPETFVPTILGAIGIFTMLF